ncbi:hypothetical protein D3C87_1554600 [compost metagenome]
MATPFKSLSKSCKQIIIKIPAAIKRFPQTNVLGNKIIRAAMIVIAPFTITVVLEKFHLLNISNISGLPESIAQPCFKPMNTATRIRMELIIFNIIKPVFFYHKGK